MKKLLLLCFLMVPALVFAEGSNSSNNKFKNLKEELTSFIIDLEVKTYVLSIKSENGYKIEEMVVRCTTGSAQVDLEIDDVVITGCNNVAVTTTTAEAACTGANLLNKGSKFELKVDSETACEDFSLGVSLRRIS